MNKLCLLVALLLAPIVHASTGESYAEAMMERIDKGDVSIVPDADIQAALAVGYFTIYAGDNFVGLVNPAQPEEQPVLLAQLRPGEVWGQQVMKESQAPGHKLIQTPRGHRWVEPGWRCTLDKEYRRYRCSKR